jgi:hypothetical protein
VFILIEKKKTEKNCYMEKNVALEKNAALATWGGW